MWTTKYEILYLLSTTTYNLIIIMIITYNGLESFKLQAGDTVLALNPISKTSKHKASSFGADVVFSTLNHHDMNGVDTVARGDKEPFAVTGPGEYEISNVFVRGFKTISQYDTQERVNTVYYFTFDGLSVCFLGALSDPKLPSEVLEAFEEIDILFLPIGGGDVLEAKEAHKLAVSLEAKMVIPMHYDEKALQAFMKEDGESPKPQDKLTLKKKDAEGKQGEVVILKAAN